MGNKQYNTLYGVAERDITSEEILRGASNYLKHQMAPGSNKIAHGILTVN